MDNDLPAHPGPYTLLKRLGGGGGGEVFLAEGPDGARVAVKTLRHADRASLPSLLGEIDALSQARHPGVARIIASGTDGGAPWYAMELIEGPTLRAWLGWDPAGATATQAWRTRPERDRARLPAATDARTTERPREEVLEALARLARTLAWLHGEGVVHLDVKPENVLMRAGRPVLVDLGLSARTMGAEGRAVLAVRDGIAGTLAYMAPEQLQGLPCDARADLYALGCVAFEALVGAHPFADQALPSAHLEATPPRLRERRPDAPEALERLIAALMVKEPSERLGYASDVVVALLDLLSPPRRQRLLQEFAAAPTPRPYLYRPRFVGREAPLSALHGYLKARLGEGRGGLLWIGGESGVGKTRFAQELGVRLARSGDVRVLTGATSDGVTPAPLRALSGLFDLAAERLDPSGDPALAHHLAALSPYAPALAALQGLPTLPPPGRGAQARLVQSLVVVAQAVAAQGPLALLLDDVQWADRLTHAFFDRLLTQQTLDDAPIALIATYRSDEADDDLLRLVEHPRSRALPLGRLDDRAVGELVRGLLSGDPPGGFLDFIAGQSEGNPFYAISYLHAAIDAHLLDRGPAGGWRLVAEHAGEGSPWERLDLPTNLRALLKRRLAALNPAELALAHRLAALGRGGGVDAVERALPEARRRPLGALERRHLVRLEGARWSFEHGALRDVLYDDLDPSTRRELHRELALALEGDLPDALVATRARHWELSGGATEARRDYLAAVRFEVARHNIYALVEYAEAFLRLSEARSPEHFEVVLAAATGKYAEGDIHAVKALTERALRDLDAHPDYPERALHRLSLRLHALQARVMSDGPVGLVAPLREMAEAFGELGEIALVGRTLALLGFTHYLQGETEQGIAALRRALALDYPDAQTSALLRGNMLYQVAHGLTLQSRTEEAEAAARASLAMFRGAEHPYGECSAMIILGNALRSQGRSEEAVTSYTDAIRGAHRMGALELEALTCGNLSYLLADLGQIDRSLELIERAIALNDRNGHHNRNAANWLSVGRTRHGLQQLDQAREAFERSLEICRVSNNKHVEGMARVGFGALESHEGHLERAEALLVEGDAINRSADLVIWIAIGESERANVARRQGRYDDARAHLERLRDLVSTIKPAYRILLRVSEVLLGLAEGAAPERVAELAEEAEGLVAEHDVRPNTTTGLWVGRMRRALQAWRAGEPLERGEACGDVVKRR